MSYKVLYRKYRPTNFSDIIDQKFITDTLKESIINNKISHAYLFSGPKGTGKTSTAKVFAKAINCENPIDGEPCEKCSSCLNFESNPDVIELDAASNNKVEDIREIINNVKLTPTNSKFKIYIIDEVHMLTNSASNAFLLTLEEPPSHAIFILATTNPESLPLTILSRCQQFAFSKISNKALIDRIKYVLNKENINMNDDIINEIASLADGGLRDALSILDQLITLNKPIDSNLLTEQFGIVSQKSVEQLINYILDNDYVNISNTFDSYKQYGISEKSFINKFINQLTNKTCELKMNNNDKLSNSLKNIVLEILKTENYKTNYNYYDVLKMIIITNLNNSKNISQEIIETKKEATNEENYDNLSFKAENNEINNDMSSNKSIDLEENNKNIEKKDSLPKVNNNEIINIRINNSFVNATKKYKNEFEKEYEKYLENLKGCNDIYSLILDTEVGVVSSTNVLIVTENESSANLLNENCEKIIEKSGISKKIVFVDKNKWNELTELYKINKNSGKKYEYINEPEIKSNDNELKNLATSIFGNEKIILEEE